MIKKIATNMPKPEQLTLAFGECKIPRKQAEVDGIRAYESFVGHTSPSLSPLTVLSFAVRNYAHLELDAQTRRTLTEQGFLMHGEKLPLKQRLRLKGRIAIALVVPEVEDGQLVGEYLSEPFKEVTYLDEWYAATRPEKPHETPLSWIPTAG